MSYIELLENSPVLFIAILFISFMVTILVYGAFPIIFSIFRKAPITKKKYKILCYGINLIGLLFFLLLNGVVSGGPYLLWTWIFSNYGYKKLKKDGLILEEGEFIENLSEKTDKICYCRKCGAKLNVHSNRCHKCGTEIRMEK